MKIRKIVKRGVFAACLLFLLLIFAGIVAIAVLLLTTPTISHGSAATTDPWQACYYVFTIIGSIGTLSAVIVALYKEELMSWINSPDLEFTLIENGLIANFDSQVGQSPDSYECSIRIANHGTYTAIGCRAYIQTVKYNKNRRE